MLTADPARLAVRRLDAGDVSALARTMARAFFDDPVAGGWCLADATDRMRTLERIFELFLRRVYLSRGECLTAGRHLGGALWLPPGAWRMRGAAQAALVARLVPVAMGATPRILRTMAFLEGRHPHEPHFYLQFLGVEPGHQRQGIGSQLLGPVLRRCDAEGVPAYLEATTARNRALYERHGFELVERVAIPGGGPPVWRMWREPRVA